MDDQKFNLVLDKLLEKTKKGKLEWETTANRNTFLAVLQDSAISINHGYQSANDVFDECHLYTFDFRNENGDVVESIAVSDSTENSEKYEKAGQIFELARSQSLNIDKTLDYILEQLAA